VVDKGFPMSLAGGSVPGMKERELFLASDDALRSVIDRLTPADLGRAVPAEWSSGHRAAALTMRDIVGRHAYDEAWVPDLLAGRTTEQVGDRWSGDLLGDDPIGSYDAIHDAATTAVSTADVDATILHFSYGDYPFAEGVLHMCSYRAFQAWLIARHLGLDFALDQPLIDGLNEHVVPTVEQLRAYGAFPPEIEPPEGADAETRLLCAVGFWHP
jgi:hypothetical protein